jgi:Cys-rich protein (TIGR01571 family)
MSPPVATTVSTAVAVPMAAPTVPQVDDIELTSVSVKKHVPRSQMQRKKKPVRAFKYELGECCYSCETCCQTCCCWPCVVASTKTQMDDSNCCYNFCCFCCCFVPCHARTVARKRWKIPGDCCMDCVTVTFCPICAAIQVEQQYRDEKFYEIGKEHEEEAAEGEEEGAVAVTGKSKPKRQQM